jgi:hypothetical protein
MFTRRGGAGPFTNISPRRGGAGPFVNPSPKIGGAGPFVNPPVEKEVKKEVEVKPSTVKTQNVFTPMDKQVTPSISPVSYKALYGEDATKPKNVSQYRNLTDLMKMNMDSLSGKIKIPDARYPAGNVFVPPGYDSDMVPFAVKISADRLGIDPKKYMDMSIMDRVKNFGTEAKSMGQELTTGVGQAIDAGKKLVSNLPMFGMLFGGTGSDAGTQQGEVIADTTANTGIMSNQPFGYTQDMFTEVRSTDPSQGMSDEMRAYFLSLDPAGREAFLLLSENEKEEQMKGAKNLPFLGQYAQYSV